MDPIQVNAILLRGLLPDVPLTLETLQIILPYSLTLAAVGLLESLLTAQIVDDMTDTPSNASNRRQPNPKRVPIIATSVGAPDLSRVDEIGFSDLMPGGWIPSTSRVNAFWLYGKAIPRK